jgi:hypothetical protein
MFLLAGLNLLYVAILITILVQLPVVQPLSHAGLRSNVEHAASVDDLRPHARTAVEMVEISDRIELWFYHHVIRLCVLGLSWAALNTAILFFSFRNRAVGGR